MRGAEAIPAVGAALARYRGELRDRARRREQPSARGRGSLPEQAVNTLASRVTPPPADVLPQAAPASGRRSCRTLNDRFSVPKFGNLEVGSGSTSVAIPAAQSGHQLTVATGSFLASLLSTTSRTIRMAAGNAPVSRLRSRRRRTADR